MFLPKLFILQQGLIGKNKEARHFFKVCRGLIQTGGKEVRDTNMIAWRGGKELLSGFGNTKLLVDLKNMQGIII